MISNIKVTVTLKVTVTQAKYQSGKTIDTFGWIRF